ncbi:MAG: alpha/beta hydrolase [Sporichthyaceae bacterium]
MASLRRGRTIVTALSALVALELAAAGALGYVMLREDDGGGDDLRSAQSLASYYEQRPTWSRCGSGFECSSITVPATYTGGRKDGEALQDLRIALIRLPASGKAMGSIVLNPGGPGGSGLDFLRQAAQSSISASVRERYDLVSFDPRGVGESSAVDCVSDRDLDAYLAGEASPDDEAEIATFDRDAREFAQACGERSGDLLAVVGTPEAARDMDVLRAVLGHDKLDYLGYSYGTYLGATYAELFPDRVGRMVLDGALDPTLSGRELLMGQARGFELAFGNFAKACAQAGCALGASESEVRVRVSELLDRLDSEALPTDSGRELTESLGALGVITGMYADESWPFLANALAAAEQGDGTDLLLLADAYASREDDGSYAGNSLEANPAVNCVDRPLVFTPEQVRESIPELEGISPTFGQYLAWGQLACTYWPVQTEGNVGALRAEGAPPIVVIGTTGDPATPYEWSRALAEQLSAGVLVTFEGDGHTAYGRGSECIADAVDGFFLDGDVPADGLRCS